MDRVTQYSSFALDMKRSLNTLTQDEYATLTKMGLLYEVYPEATGDWDRDTNHIETPKDPTVAIHKVTLIVMSLNGDCETEEDVILDLENLKHPEFVDVIDVQTKRIVWSDDHPLNKLDKTVKSAAIKELFP